jgi:hypothetical protein
MLTVPNYHKTEKQAVNKDGLCNASTLTSFRFYTDEKKQFNLPFYKKTFTFFNIGAATAVANPLYPYCRRSYIQ